MRSQNVLFCIQNQDIIWNGISYHCYWRLYIIIWKTQVSVCYCFYCKIGTIINWYMIFYVGHLIEIQKESRANNGSHIATPYSSPFLLHVHLKCWGKKKGKGKKKKRWGVLQRKLLFFQNEERLSLISTVSTFDFLGLMRTILLYSLEEKHIQNQFYFLKQKSDNGLITQMQSYLYSNFGRNKRKCLT